METKPSRKPYPSDVTDEEWAFVAPYLTLMRPDAPQRVHDVREVYDALRWMLRAGAPWRYLPTHFPPWEAVYQQTQRWIAAGCFADMVHDLRVLLRWLQGRADTPTAAILDSRTSQSTPESGHRAGYDGATRRKGAKVHLAIDTLGDLLALHVTPADAQDRAQVDVLAQAIRAGPWKSPSSIRATPARRPPPRRPTTASRWRWSGCPRPSAGSSCCPAAGWSSAVSPGLPGFDGSPETMNGCRKRLLACILWPLPA